MTKSTPFEPIAVVGLSLRLPGGANDVDGLWKLLESGEPAWTPVPAERYNEEAFYHPNADDPNGTSNHKGGHFISGDIRDFDHSFFRFSKPQAAAIDPQQRLLMELAYEALENAGIPQEKIAGTATSVYTAIFPTDYTSHLYRDTLDMPTYYMTGNEVSIMSNRLSHVLDLRGPSMTLDTACSGGLVALHQACQSLRDGESDTSLVSASNLILSPDHFIGLSNLHLLSSKGRCFPFDERGNGYGRGEGVTVLVLKRLNDAVRDNDPIHAVIRSTAAGQDGYTPQNLTYPNSQAQADLARLAYKRAGLRPEEVAYVEAHDRVELAAISEVFANTQNRPVPLYVGSIKGAIGHTEAVAGLAGLLKSIVMLDREMIPPVAGFETPKANLPLDRMVIPSKLIPWPHATGITPRISISSFGFGGANAHAILERGPRSSRHAAADESRSPRLFVLSANSPASLKTMIQAQHDWVERRTEVSLVDLSYTLSQRRSALKYRFSTVARDRTSLLAALKEGIATPPTKPSADGSDIVMVFTGQGAQWAGMGRELLLDQTTPSSIFRDSIRRSRDILKQLGATWDLEEELLRDSGNSRLNEAELAQPATTSTQIALVTLLQAQGVSPKAVVGHSSGEIAAAFAAGHLSQSTAMKVAFFRGAMAAAVKTKTLGPGAMLSVGLGQKDAAKYVNELSRGKVVIACINSPKSVTISGDADAVDEVDERIAAMDDGTFHRKLLVDTAYHSHHMQTVADDYLKRLGTLKIEDRTASGSETIAFFSSVTGQPKTSGFGAEYWVQNLVSPVRFSEAVQSLRKTRHASSGQACFVEVGPASALAGPVRQCLQDADMPKTPFVYHAPLQRKVDALSSSLAMTGKLFEAGLRISWDPVLSMAFGAESAVVKADLPAYSWDHSTKHWYESRVAKAYRLRKEPYHDLLGVPVLDATELEPRWRHFLSKTTMPWLADHVVDGLAVFPGAGYLAMAIEGAAQLARQRHVEQKLEMVALRDINFKRGLVVPDSQRVEVQLSFKPQQRSNFTFSFSIMALADGGEWYEHCTGVVEGVLAENESVPEDTAELLSDMPAGSDTTPKDILYRDMEAAGNYYGPTFAGLHSITMAADASRALSSFDVLDIQASMPYKHMRPHLIHPSTLDLVFHTALPLVGRRLGPGAIMPVHIQELLIPVDPALHKPGSSLDVSVQLTSSHFRTAVSDISVLAKGRRVLSLTGMELRSLGSRSDGSAGATDAREICYELNWQPTIEHVRAEDLPTAMTLSDLIAQTTFKQRGQAVIGLGAGVDLTEGLLNAVQVHNKVTSHDFVDSTPGHFEDAFERLKGFQAQYRVLRPNASPARRGFDLQTYDIALAASAQRLKQAAELVKPGGTVVLALSGPEAKDDAWRADLQKESDPLDEQLALHEKSTGRLIVIAKASNPQILSKVHILTHSTNHAPAWVLAIEDGLRNRGIQVVTNSLSLNNVDNASGNKAIVVVDDVPNKPILSDGNIFDAAIALLTRKTRVVWLSPDDPVPFHQIEGVARTAHAENDDLRLTTIHAASGFLAKRIWHKRLATVVASAISQVENVDVPNLEREYRIRDKGTVVVPRLEWSDRLNRAIAADSESRVETDNRRFTEHEQSLVLSSDGSHLFIEDLKASTAPLAQDAIEIEVQTFLLPKAGSSAPTGECAGVITHIGTNVKDLAIGDHVIALTSTVGASRLRIPRVNASRIPSTVSDITASALLLNAVTASYALRGVARLLSSGGVALIHGARTPIGRAVVAVARMIGVRVVVTAADQAEAGIMKQQLDIDAPDVLVARRSLGRRAPQDIFSEGLDVVIQASEDAAPVEALAFVKPFGSVVSVTQSSNAASSSPKLPPNVALYNIDIASLIKFRPDLIANLVTEGAMALEHIPLSGMDIPVRDVAEIAEALRLVNTGVQSSVVMQVHPESIVSVIPSPKTNYWAIEDATYVVVGGLGDIGGRLLTQMAQHGAKHLATISRRKIEPDAHRALQTKLQAIRPGIRLYILQGDVSSEESLQAAAAKLAKSHAPPVRGVIMAATYMHDRPLESTTRDDFTSVTSIKVDGTPALHRSFASPDLAFFLCLSSVSSIVGASAEASYNAGNALQDALAHQERHDSDNTRFVTMNFGWIEDAVLTKGDETREGALRRAGFSRTSSAELTRFFDYVLDAVNDPDSRLSRAIIGFDPKSLADATAYNGAIQSAMFNQVREARGGAGGEDESSGTESAANSWQTFEKLIADGDSEGVTDFISNAVTGQLARLISVDASSMDARQGSILALGLDSLVAVELRNWIVRQFEAPLQSTEILANQTVYTLAGKIAERSKKVAGSAA